MTCSFLSEPQACAHLFWVLSPRSAPAPIFWRPPPPPVFKPPMPCGPQKRDKQNPRGEPTRTKHQNRFPSPPLGLISVVDFFHMAFELPLQRPKKEARTYIFLSSVPDTRGFYPHPHPPTPLKRLSSPQARRTHVSFRKRGASRLRIERHFPGAWKQAALPSWPSLPSGSRRAAAQPPSSSSSSSSAF
jgi:hypothetical protein